VKNVNENTSFFWEKKVDLARPLKVRDFGCRRLKFAISPLKVRDFATLT
jgi:hypothetical protein